MSKTPKNFDPDRIAYFECAGWRAYYEKKWLKLFWLITRLCQTQFFIPFPFSLLSAYFIIRGAIAWVPLVHNEQKIYRFFEKFYGMAGFYGGLNIEPSLVAKLELKYWDDHRRLVGQKNKTEFIKTLTELHSALFGITPEEAKESAELRVKAAEKVDLITNKQSIDVEGDWNTLEEDLRQCYKCIKEALKSSGVLFEYPS